MTYLEEDNILFNDILTRNYFLPFQKRQKKIEFQLSGLCSANCQYCYLKAHQKELFPIELYNKEQIVKNFELLIKWYIKNNFNCEIDLFSGEWLTTDLMEPILEILYNNFKNIPQYSKPEKIVIPDNMKFINNDKLTQKIQHYIDIFNEIGIKIVISASIDGAICEFGRTEQNEEFYIKCFNFCTKNNFLCHPMVSSQNIKYWIENYLWWVENAPQEITKTLMMLEVRDETWKTEDIDALLNFCNFLIDFKFKYYFNENLLDFINYIFHTNKSKLHCQYSPEIIPIKLYQNYNTKRITCSFSDEFMIRVADLSINLCHRLTYEELILGKFIVENNEISRIQANENKVPLLVVKTHFNRTCTPCCEKCLIEPICTGFCCGNSYENFKNILVPAPEVCNMYKAKFGFLIKKYDQMGVFKYLEEHPDTLSPISQSYILDLKNNINKLF